MDIINRFQFMVLLRAEFVCCPLGIGNQVACTVVDSSALIGLMNCLVICSAAGEKTVLLSQLMNRQVFDYRAYKDVQIFHYNIPEQVSKATWNYSAIPTSLTACDIRNVSV